MAPDAPGCTCAPLQGAMQTDGGRGACGRQLPSGRPRSWPAGPPRGFQGQKPQTLVCVPRGWGTGPGAPLTPHSLKSRSGLPGVSPESSEVGGEAAGREAQGTPSLLHDPVHGQQPRVCPQLSLPGCGIWRSWFVLGLAWVPVNCGAGAGAPQRWPCSCTPGTG